MKQNHKKDMAPQLQYTTLQVFHSAHGGWELVKQELHFC